MRHNFLPGSDTLHWGVSYMTGDGRNAVLLQIDDVEGSGTRVAVTAPEALAIADQLRTGTATEGPDGRWRVAPGPAGTVRLILRAPAETTLGEPPLSLHSVDLPPASVADMAEELVHYAHRILTAPGV